MTIKDNIEEIFVHYCLWAIAAIMFFTVMLFMVSFIVFIESPTYLMPFLILLSGFGWIGATAVSRHYYVLLKGQIGGKISMLEFFLTQFIVLMFPVTFIRLKRQISQYKKLKKTGEKAIFKNRH